MTHTPGPWQVNASSDHRSWGYVRREDDERKVIAIAQVFRRHGWDEYQANARLIAAAPEMLTALQAIAGMTVEDSTDHAQLVALCIAIARAAIAKATEG